MRLFTNSLGSSSNTSSVIQVLIIAGQSNALGTTNGIAPSAPYDVPNTNGYIMGDNTATGGGVFPTFNIMDYATGNFVGTEFSVEASFAYSFNNNPVYIVKITQSGTNLAVSWATGSSNRNTLISFINNAKAYFITNGITVQWNLFWDQWEADTLSTSWANAYETNYKNFISEVLGSTSITLNKHIIQKVNTNSNFYINHLVDAQTILAAQTANTSFYGALLIDNDDLTLWDSVHYSAGSNITRGERLYALL